MNKNLDSYDDNYNTTESSSFNIEAVVGTWIRIYRVEANLTQRDLAEKIGISPQQLQKYEKSTSRITVYQLHQIATILNRSIYLFFESLGPSAEELKRRRSSRIAHPATLEGTDNLNLINNINKYDNKNKGEQLLVLFNSIKSERLKDSIVDLLLKIVLQ